MYLQQKLKTYGPAAVVLAALFLAGSIIESRDSRASGAFSSPVSVFNTVANPVPSMEASSPIPYRVRVVNTSCSAGCVLTFGPVPNGYRLVVERVSGVLNFTGSSVPDTTLTSTGNIATTSTEIVGGGNFITSGGYVFGVPVRQYFDPSDGPIVLTVQGTFVSGAGNVANLVGYLINCSQQFQGVCPAALP